MLTSTKPGKCIHCRVRLTEAESAECRTIHLSCVAPWMVVRKAKEAAAWAKKRAKAAKVDRAETRAKLEKLKSRGEWLKEAKVAVQQSRRLEEMAKGRGCMSCGRTQAEVMGTDSWKPGGAWDGGHFLSKGAYPELALEPKNIWLQCKSCNAGSSKYARKGFTVNQSFRANLSAWEGEALVEWLEGPHEPKNYTIDDLKAIKDENNAKSNALKKAAA